ncbi:MAG: hypothetical protein MJZ77_07125 [Bacteroidales bacterium]|nr:hypothetical protein [Bacteroidales bacterium]
MSRKMFPILVVLLTLSFASCKVDFSPNAPWRDVPAVFCVLDPDEDTVWARVQRCYLGEDNLYNYSEIADSNYYLPEDIQVSLLAWKGIHGPYNSLTKTNQLVDRWELTYTTKPGKPEGSFPGGLQPLYYCVPGHSLVRDSDCVYQLVVVRSQTGDTLAQATTTLVGYLRPAIHGRDTVENVLISPSWTRGNEFGYRIGCRGELTWYALPRARMYQPIVTFYYRKGGDTLSLDIAGPIVKNQHNSIMLSYQRLTQERFLSVIKDYFKDNRDTLLTANNVDININACNEDLNAYISSQNNSVVSGQDFHSYSNIEGGVGIFGSRRTHIRVNVPCDSSGKEGYIPQQLISLGVGFYGNFGSK